MGGEIYWPNKGRFPYLVNIFFIWLPPAKFWQRIIKTVWIPTIFAGGNVIPYLVNIFVPPLSDPLYGQYIIPPSLLWSIYHPLMTVIYFIPILVNILIDFIIFCNMIVQAEFLCLQHPCGYCGTPSIRDVLPLELSPVCDLFPTQAPALQCLFSSPINSTWRSSRTYVALWVFVITEIHHTTAVTTRRLEIGSDVYYEMASNN